MNLHYVRELYKMINPALSGLYLTETLSRTKRTEEKVIWDYFEICTIYFAKPAL